ncbi:MAG: VWA-like domain-containing protein [Chloroflexota bacterium]
MTKKKKSRHEIDPATQAYFDGWAILHEIGLFDSMQYYLNFVRQKNNQCPPGGWALAKQNGVIHIHPTKRADPKEWAYVLAHCMLHYAFDHFRVVPTHQQQAWNAACDCFITHYLDKLKLGRAPIEFTNAHVLPDSSEAVLLNRFLADGIPEEVKFCSTSGPQGSDMVWDGVKLDDDFFYTKNPKPVNWPRLFAQGVGNAAHIAIAKAAEVDISVDYRGRPIYDSPGERARHWFINSFPLLGALAASFKVIEKQQLLTRMGIHIAAVNPSLQEIYINPAAGLTEQEYRFVMAHEFLHVGLRHDARQQGRDPYLWNVACDFVINDWLIEMGVGAVPRLGLLYDPDLKGMSAEEIYDRIVNDMRTYRKLRTLRGKGIGDIILDGNPSWWKTGNGITLDDFYRRALQQGLTYHQDQGRGFLPAGLIEEIQALTQPPIPWDVELAQWFDTMFPPIEKQRTYARPSRRQSSTPNIPRPSWVAPPLADGRTFAVILDTSGSMSRKLLARALGAIASYSLSRDVYQTRVIFCDATYYDQGYMSPEDIASRVQIKGRGGTILQPAINYLNAQDDFPPKGPVLIITDGYCDQLRFPNGREHAYLIPQGNRLPFKSVGPVFYVAGDT